MTPSARLPLLRSAGDTGSEYRFMFETLCCYCFTIYFRKSALLPLRETGGAPTYATKRLKRYRQTVFIGFGC